MASLGQYNLIDALNRALPVLKRFGFGTWADQITNAVNGLAQRLDQTGIAASATVTSTMGGTINAGDTYTLTVLNPSITVLQSPGVVLTSQTVLSTDTLALIAQEAAALINTNSTMVVAGITASSSGSVVTASKIGTIGNSTTITSALKSGASVTVTMGNAGVMAGGTGTFGTGNAALFGGITPLANRP